MNNKQKIGEQIRQETEIAVATLQNYNLALGGQHAKADQIPTSERYPVEIPAAPGSGRAKVDMETARGRLMSLATRLGLSRAEGDPKALPALKAAAALWRNALNEAETFLLAGYQEVASILGEAADHLQGIEESKAVPMAEAWARLRDESGALAYRYQGLTWTAEELDKSIQTGLVRLQNVVYACPEGRPGLYAVGAIAPGAGIIVPDSEAVK